MHWQGHVVQMQWHMHLPRLHKTIWHEFIILHACLESEASSCSACVACIQAKGSFLFCADALLFLLQGKRVVVSGSGNVSTFAIQKLLELGAIPITASDSTGFVYEKDGFTQKTLEHLIDVKVTRRGTLKDYNSGRCSMALCWKCSWMHPGPLQLPSSRLMSRAVG